MNGFDLSQLSETIKQLEQLGADMNAVSERVLDAGSEPARRAFINNMPPNSKKDKPHARNNVIVSKTRTARKSKSRYRVIGALDPEFKYLYYVENGHVRATEHPFVEKAYRAAQAAASDPMEKVLLQEIENHLK
jgi:HK97 gp10 family phage protein